jgi:sugar phosphate isomerase/epimerase
VSGSLLGANCLPAYFMADVAATEAHRIALDTVAAAGFTATEVSLPGLLTLREAPSVREHAHALGIDIHAVHAPPMRRDPALARQRQSARLAAELGASVLVVHVSSLRFASPDPGVRTAARDRDLRRLDLLAEFSRPLGITIGLENGKHPDHAAYLRALLDTLISPEPRDQSEPHPPGRDDPPPQHPTPRVQRLSPSPLGLVFDSGHAALGGDPVSVAQAMLPHLIHTHLHDNNGRRDEHLPPGDGCIDWPALLRCLTAGNYSGPLLIELRPRSGQTSHDWQQELLRARNLLSAVLS